MDWKAIIFFVFLNVIFIQAKLDPDIKKIIDIIMRSSGKYGRRHSSQHNILGVPTYPEDLPAAEDIIPGHTLIRPSMGMLKSAVKFPLRDNGMAVYGNLDNLGITYGKTNERILYTGFRRTNNRLLASTILQAIRNILKSNGNSGDGGVYVLEIDHLKRKSNTENPQDRMVSEEENNASEILERPEDSIDLRRASSKYRDRKDQYSSSDVSDESRTDRESDFEQNPGNPYTVYKEKYRQNFLWKHDMDGDHMNINPTAPFFTSGGPTGADIFFARKWWYFNQDDYKPLG